ncbi:thioesterase family protein [Halobacterium yunchengense]|uniref:thioesterase family protein n=1 Tax=Halobacterium yunchengense TaxID=3108497 RepID=UPI003008F3EF
MSDAFAALADADVHGEATFTLDADSATVAFGPQYDPPGDPAATDAASEEATCVLGTPRLLAHFEVVARESLRGRLADGDGVITRGASLSHLAPVGVGGDVDVTATLVAVDRPDLSFACRAERADGTAVATGDLTLRVVDRERFRASVADRV